MSKRHEGRRPGRPWVRVGWMVALPFIRYG